jgi:hypothetical protein
MAWIDWEELMRLWQREYWGEHEAWLQGPTSKVQDYPSFYDWLLQRGKANRFQLSAHGVGRDIDA